MWIYDRGVLPEELSLSLSLPFSLPRLFPPLPTPYPSLNDTKMILQEELLEYYRLCDCDVVYNLDALQVRDREDGGWMEGWMMGERSEGGREGKR